MVNGFYDLDEPRWSESEWTERCYVNSHWRSLAAGNAVVLNFRDAVEWERQSVARLCDIGLVAGKWCAEIRWPDGTACIAPLWALTAVE